MPNDSDAQESLGKEEIYLRSSFENVQKRQLEPKYIVQDFKQVKT